MILVEFKCVCERGDKMWRRNVAKTKDQYYDEYVLLKCGKKKIYLKVDPLNPDMLLIGILARRFWIYKLDREWASKNPCEAMRYVL